MTSLLTLAIRMKVEAAVIVLWMVLTELDNGWEGGLKKDDSMGKWDNIINFGLKIDIWPKIFLSFKEYFFESCPEWRVLHNQNLNSWWPENSFKIEIIVPFSFFQ